MDEAQNLNENYPGISCSIRLSIQDEPSRIRNLKLMKWKKKSELRCFPTLNVLSTIWTKRNYIIEKNQFES
jgi:hypothetical protein